MTNDLICCDVGHVIFVLYLAMAKHQCELVLLFFFFFYTLF